MSEFRKRPVIVDAMQWDGSLAGARAIQDWCRVAGVGCGAGLPVTLEIVTLEGIMKASAGDWIVKGVQGEVYPIKPDIFAATYEPVES